MAKTFQALFYWREYIDFINKSMVIKRQSTMRTELIDLYLFHFQGFKLKKICNCITVVTDNGYFTDHVFALPELSLLQKIQRMLKWK